MGNRGERREGDAPPAEGAEGGLRFRDRRGRPAHLKLRLLRAQARRLGRVLDNDSPRPFALEERKSVPFDRGDVEREAQVIAAPWISRDDEDIDFLVRHRVAEPASTLSSSSASDL